MRTFLAVLFAAALSSCASVPQARPSKERPLLGCRVICVNVTGIGRSETLPIYFKVQKRCAEGLRRQFQDVRIVGERRTVDQQTGKEIELWISTEGDYPKDAVVLQSCDSYVSAEQSKIDASQRGRFPGEDDLGRPKQ